MCQFQKWRNKLKKVIICIYVIFFNFCFSTFFKIFREIFRMMFWWADRFVEHCHCVKFTMKSRPDQVDKKNYFFVNKFFFTSNHMMTIVVANNYSIFVSLWLDHKFICANIFTNKTTYFRKKGYYFKKKKYFVCKYYREKS